MPFGAEVREGGVRFRLWAPSAGLVELLPDDGPALPMDAVGDGWHETFSEGAAAGTTYSYRIDRCHHVPDPAARAQRDDVHGPSVVIDPEAFEWRHHAWRGRPWHEAVVYELHVGTFSPEGTFDGARQRLDHLVDLGVTAIELMPIGDFPGRRNWGYDGVLTFAPDTAYGSPDDLKRLVDAAHGRGVMVFLDVVYNHFGPDGNYLHRYAPDFFTDRFETPWGAAIDYGRREVRDFAIHNALYWLQEYRLDGLRLDAVHEIVDERTPHLLDELAAAVRRDIGAERRVHLVLENEHNEAGRLARDVDGRPQAYTAQWNDDVHHALHVLATGEREGYYADYADRPLEHLARCLSEGFAYQGEPFRQRDGAPRGTPSAELPPTAFVSFMQNHDQVGNRAFGERLGALTEPRVRRALSAVLLLAPQPPILFMGEEWAASEPFLFFCDFHDELADAVREGRRKEFASFAAFHDVQARSSIPDPNAEATFLRSRLDWDRVGEGEHEAWLEHYRELIAIRHREIVPRIPHLRAGAARAAHGGDGGLEVCWPLAGDASELVLRANLAALPSDGRWAATTGRLLYASADAFAPERSGLAPWSVSWYLTS
ncbi:MAG: malto-oligosyltrehalose trehalohydrolase [Trueperaceae bacterium]|nr:malto-oligosyltrehalose trehalohydrolase [Trueperaceae bacterium]